MSIEVAPQTKHRAGSTQWMAHACGAALLAYGVFLRLWIYFQNYSLNHDEAALALNVMHRSTAELMRPLDYLQAAPFGFLLVERGVMQSAGSSELALRAFPLFCSIAALVLFWRFVRRRTGMWAHVAAIGFLAVSQDLVAMSPRVKHYSTEVLATVLLLFICEWLLDEYPSRRKLWASTLLGALLPWFAFASIFVVAGIGSTCVLVALRRRELLLRYTGVFAVWGLSIAGLLLAVMRLGGARQGLIRFWSADFMPIAHPAAILPWLWREFLTFGGSVISVRLAPLAAIALAVGIVMAIRSREWSRIALVASIAWCLLASALRQYPFNGRFLFFLVPAALVLIVEPLSELPPSTVRKAFFAVATIALAYASASAAKNLLFSPPAREDDPRAVLVEIRRQWQPGDQIYLSSGATPPFLYYQRRLGFGDTDYVTGRDPGSFTWGPVFAEFPAARRVWFMYLPQLDGSFDSQAMERARKKGEAQAFIDRGFYVAKLLEISSQ